MKLSSFSFIAFSFALLTSMNLFSCERDDNTPTEDLRISEEDAVDLLTGAIIYSSEGIATEAADAAKMAEQVEEKGLTAIGCGEAGDSTVVRNYDKPRITAAYNSTFSWLLNCNSIGVPTVLEFDRTTNGEYATNRIESTDSATSDWEISELITGPNYILNGTYTRTGQQTSLVRNQQTFNSSISLTLDNINIDKGQRRIVSGIASFTLTGQTTDGQDFSFDGDIVFLGSGAANVIINGNTYEIELF